VLCAAPLYFARRFSPTSAELGEAGERIAARHLRANGLVLLGRRVSTRCGEIDLVLTERGRLVCVEVKTSLRARGGIWRPGDRWRRAAFERQCSAAGVLAARGLGRGKSGARLDRVEVWIGPRGRPAEIHHHRGLCGPLPPCV
jgi:putative endonuclease